MVDFKVIEIINEKDIYPTLLGFKWANDNEAIINLKREEMSFKENGTRVIQPIELINRERYT
jgi:hypothetical protein